MMYDLQESNMFDDFADDLLGERTARPLVIIGASKIDSLLLQILSTYLLPKRTKAKDQDELLEGDRPLGTFSARIKMCYRLGLIDETLYLALEQVRVLRNPSAHSIAFDIMKSPTREHVAELRKSIINRLSFQQTKRRYFDDSPLNSIDELQCVLLTLCVLLEIIRENVSTTHGIKIALSIANR
jgi:DNA-binding MltR family transcriptional regulator